MTAQAITQMYGISAAAQMLGISTFTLRRRIADGSIASVNIGSRVLISAEQIAKVQREGVGQRRKASNGR